MKGLFAFTLAGVIGSITLVATLAKADAPGESSPYVVDTYDPQRNVEEDIKMAVASAKRAGKHVLLQVGGDWCGWCHLMSKYFKENEKVATALAKNYLIVKVNYSSENDNKEFLSKLPQIKGYPHLFVLDSDGKLLHSQDTAKLEEGKGYSEEAMLGFLSNWAPKK